MERLDKEKREGLMTKSEIILRQAENDDLEWVVKRHGAIYCAEYGWDMRFEELVAKIMASFAASKDADHGCGWIAEASGKRAGSIFLMKESADTARLRLLLVEPEARNLGIGTALVKEALAFARSAGYRRVVLWTNSVLTAAAGIYRRLGFTIISEEPHCLWGVNLTGQTYQLDL
jgi:GNAT superfamily N-acetyltransferase